MMRARLFIIALVVAAGACGGSSAPAPEPGPVEVICADVFCIDVPDDWEIVEQGDDFISLRHSTAPDNVVATVGMVNMEGIASAAGGRWPLPTDAVVRYFWTLIDGGEAEMETLDAEPDRSVFSFGRFAEGRLWYRLVPIDTQSGVGAEMRVPDATWARHADAILRSVVIVPS